MRLDHSRLDQLREGITNLEKAKVDQEKKSEEMHRVSVQYFILWSATQINNTVGSCLRFLPVRLISTLSLIV